jgi:hypothetical protein
MNRKAKNNIGKSPQLLLNQIHVHRNVVAKLLTSTKLVQYASSIIFVL